MKRNQQLDGLRGLAILWVVGYHLLTCYGVHPWLEALPVVPALLRLGWIGVSLFFAISGYLITGILVGNKERPGYFAAFVVKRSARILPAYALLIATFLLATFFWDPLTAAPVTNREIPLWSHLAFLQNFPMAATGYLGNDWLRVTWSLAVEIQYYVLAAILVWITPVRRLPLLLALLALGALALRCWLQGTGANQAALMVLTPCRMDSFALGGLVAVTGIHFRPATRFYGAVALGIISTLLFAAYANGLFGAYSKPLIPFYYTALSVGSAALVAMAAEARTALRGLQQPILVNIGRTSYFIYLFHLPVALVAYEIFRHSRPDAQSNTGLGMALAAFLSCWLLANLSWKFVESPIIDYGNRRLKNT